MSERWEPTIQAFEERDREAPPVPGAMLFTGSSTIVRWETLADDFPFAPVLNRGFGGSQVADLLEYADRVIVAYRPRVVVIYSGDNDFTAGKSVGQIVGDYAELERRVHAALPATPLVIIGLKPSERCWQFADAMREFNARLADWARGTADVELVPIWAAMVGADGRPRPELYCDGLHLTPEGYRIVTERLAPRLRVLWEATDTPVSAGAP